MDPLSDVLSLLRPSSSVSSGVDVGGDWALQFPAQDRLIKCYAVVTGGCWLAVDGVAGAIRLKTGDYFPPPRPGAVVRINGGGDFFLVGSRFGVRGGHADILMRMLPPVVHIRDESERDALRWAVERMMHELRFPQAGGSLIVQHLAHMMLIQALRLHLAGDGATGTGWLAGVADRQLGAALGAIHADPAQRWTLQDLAARAWMSRSAFARKFRTTVGSSPMGYVTRWRMLLAADRLEHARDSVADVAYSLGYESEAAFSAAFKRVMGESPRRYARGVAAERSRRQLADEVPRA
jgi:AraC-like DNA-binding protein